MKPIYHYILALMALILVSCAERADEPAAKWAEGEVPLSLRAVRDRESRGLSVIPLNANEYDIYGTAVYYNALNYSGYYTLDGMKPKYFKMQYDTEDKIFFIPGFFFPMSGKLDIFSYGVPTGKSIPAKSLPETLSDPMSSADYMRLDLTGDYDGSYEIIAADRIIVNCSTSLKPELLPYGHYHHFQTHLNFHFKWASDVAESSSIIDRVQINSVRIDGTSSNGYFYVGYEVADGHWDNEGDDAVVPNFTPSMVDYTDGLDVADGVYVIPQAKRKRIIVNYTIVNSNSESRSMNYVVGDDPNLPWEAGHRYTYNITIGKFGNVQISNVTVNRFVDCNVGITEIK